MANYDGGGAPQWSLPQDAALQAQQAYQAQAAAVAYPNHSGMPMTSVAPHAITPPPSGDVIAPLGGVNVHRNNRMARMEDKVLVTRTADEETEDGRIRNKEAMAKIRDAWVYKQIRARVDEFTEYKQVRSYVLYYSVMLLRPCRLSFFDF
jgi:hypothetical protein